MADRLSVVTTSLVLFLFLRGFLMKNQLNRLNKHDCTCPSDLVQYECVTNGTGTTLYNINGCKLRLLNNRFGTDVSRDDECADQVSNILRAVVEGVETLDNCHISSLNFTALSNATVECSLEGDSASLRTDYVQVITRNFIFPSTISVDENHAERVCTFNWSFDCPSVHYNLQFNCSSGSSCRVDDDYRVRCSHTEPGSQCSVQLQPVVCGDIIGQYSPVASCTINGTSKKDYDSVIAGVVVAFVMIVGILVGGVILACCFCWRRRLCGRVKTKPDSQPIPLEERSIRVDDTDDSNGIAGVQQSEMVDDDVKKELEKERKEKERLIAELEQEKKKSNMKSQKICELEEELKKKSEKIAELELKVARLEMKVDENEQNAQVRNSEIWKKIDSIATAVISLNNKKASHEDLRTLQMKIQDHDHVNSSNDSDNTHRAKPVSPEKKLDLDAAGIVMAITREQGTGAVNPDTFKGHHVLLPNVTLSDEAICSANNASD